MKRRPLTKEDLVDTNYFLLSIYHYVLNGTKRRFFLPRLVKGTAVLDELRHLKKTHNVFRYKFHFSDFPHTPEIYDDIRLKHEGWKERIAEYEARVPYLTSSLASLEEMEVFYG